MIKCKGRLTFIG